MNAQASGLTDDELVEEFVRRQLDTGAVALSKEIIVGGIRHDPGQYLVRRDSMFRMDEPRW